MANQLSAALPGSSGVPDIRGLTAAMNQFQGAAQLMSARISRMTIEAFGAAAGLGAANDAFAGLSEQLIGTRDAVASTRVAFEELDQTMAQMGGPAALQSSLVALNREAEFVRGGIDTLLNPALGGLLPIMGRVYDAMGVLATASVRFGNAMIEVLNGVTRAAVAALSNLSRASAAGGARGGGAEPPNFNNAFENFIANENVGRIVGDIPFGGAGLGVIGGLTELIRGPEKERRLREWHQNQIVGAMPQAAAELGPPETGEALRSAQSTKLGLERRLAEVERQARSERGRREDIIEPRSGRTIGTRVINEPTAQTQQLLEDAQWAVRANREWITSLTRHQNALAEQNRASEATIERLTGAAGSIDVAGVTGNLGNPQERAAFAPQPPVTALRNEAAGVRDLIRDYQYRRDDQQDTSEVFEQLYNVTEELRNKLAGGGLTGAERGTYGELVTAIKRAVPTLDRANQVVNIEPVTLPVVPVGDLRGAGQTSPTPRPPVGIRAIETVLEALQTVFTRATAWAKEPARAVAGWAQRKATSAANWTADKAVRGANWAGDQVSSVYKYATRAPVVGGLYKQAAGLVTKDFSKERVKQNLTPVANQFAGLAASLGPLGMVATLLGGVFQGLAPLIDAVKEPLRIVGEIFGKALAPILKALFPVFKLIAIAATYVGEGFFKVTGWILTAIGNLVHWIGKAIDDINPFGDGGKGLRTAGRAMMDLGKGFSQSADALAEGREEIRKLEFGETAETVEKANEAMSNVPEGFKVAIARFEAASPVASSSSSFVAASVPASALSSSTATAGSSPVTIQSVQIVSDDPERIWRELKTVIERESYRNGGSIVALA